MHDDPIATVEAELPTTRLEVPMPAELEARLAQIDADACEFLAARAGRRTMREKFFAGMSGLKHAFRGDSSFFAHAYRGLLIALTAALLGIGPLAWCILVLAAAMVLVAELCHSAVDTLARALGDPEEPSLKAAREIATAGVLVAVTAMAAISTAILSLKLGDLLGWW